MVYIEIELEYIAGTYDALLLSDGDKEAWIPVSQIKESQHYYHYDQNMTYTFEISEWILEEKEFI